MKKQSIYIVICTVAALTLSQTAEAQRAPVRPHGIFGVRKNAISNSTVYGSNRKGIHANYYGSDPQSQPQDNNAGKDDNRPTKDDSDAPTGERQAIPEHLIQKVTGE